jgi:outer membrane immunogenic protein
LKSLKLALLGATFLAGAAAISGAQAADVYTRGGSVKDTGPVDYAPAITWGGFYAGIHAGSTFNDEISISVDDIGSGALEVDDTFVAGVHVGYNWQTARNVVLGIEGNVTFPSDDEFFADYFASIRGRLGYAVDKTLFYGTGGVAILAWDEDSSFADTSVGWVAGLGVEHKIRDNLSIGVESLYYSFEEEFAGGAIEQERDFWTVQARLTYHFNSDRHSDPLK